MKTLNPIWLPNQVTNDQSQRTNNVKHPNQQTHAKFESIGRSGCGVIGENMYIQNFSYLPFVVGPTALELFSYLELNSKNLKGIELVLTLLDLVQKSSE